MIKIDTVNVAQPVDLIAQYKDVFEGLGHLEGDYHIKMERLSTLSAACPKTNSSRSEGTAQSQTR